MEMVLMFLESLWSELFKNVYFRQPLIYSFWLMVLSLKSFRNIQEQTVPPKHPQLLRKNHTCYSAAEAFEGYIFSSKQQWRTDNFVQQFQGLRRMHAVVFSFQFSDTLMLYVPL